ncbi:MAG: Gx transporter family protein [Treponema sp.]|jgi:heptaprenyl diphosphate synthase|nr:Gx transporter family protein [Treponema sp.]
MPLPGKSFVFSPRASAGDNGITALLGGLCLFLSVVEYLVPKPLPFMRIGLANLPLLLALDLFSPGRFALLVLVKILGQGIVSGTLFSYVFLFSLAGTAASALVMYGLRRAAGKRSGFAGLGAAGAFASNAVQLILARYVVFGSSVRYLVPPFLASGAVSGFALGLFCGYFTARSTWYGRLRSPRAPENAAPPSPSCEARRDGKSSSRERRRERWDRLFPPGELFAAGLAAMCFFLFNPSTASRAVQFFFFMFLAFLSGKKINPLVTVFVMAGIVFFNLLAPYGRVIAEWGVFRVTEGALFAGLRRAFTLEGLLMLSGACIRPGLRFPGGAGVLLAESFGVLGRLRERKFSIRPGHIVEGLDKALLELDARNQAPPEDAPSARGTVLSRLFLALMAAAPAVPAVLTAAGFWQAPRWLPGSWG